MTGWKQERCMQQPEALQLIAPDLYMQRRNITEVTHEADAVAGTEAYTEWTCESREISRTEYNMIQSIAEIDAQKAIDSYTEQLMEEGLL